MGLFQRLFGARSAAPSPTPPPASAPGAPRSLAEAFARIDGMRKLNGGDGSGAPLGRRGATTEAEAAAGAHHAATEYRFGQQNGAVAQTDGPG
jgi:hypothetical protein